MGSGPKNTTTTTIAEPPEYIKPYIFEMLDRAGALSDQPYQQYGGQRVADFTDQQLMGMQMTQDRAMYGDPFQDYTKNNVMGLAGQGPYMGGQAGSAARGQAYSAGNKYLGQYDPTAVEAGTNAMLGMDNPYLQQAIDYAQRDISNQYNDVVNPQLAAMERAAGAFGNSGQQNEVRKARDDFTDSLGEVSNSMRMQDYALQTQLQEADVARKLAAGQWNEGMQQSTWGMNLGEQGNLSRQNASLKTQASLANAAAANQMAMFNAAQRQNAYDTNNQFALQAAQLAPMYQGMDYLDAQKMMGVGDVIRDYNQSLLDVDYADWMSEQQWPYQQLDLIQNAIRTVMGGGGSSTTSAPNANYGNTLQNIAGYGALLKGILE